MHVLFSCEAQIIYGRQLRISARYNVDPYSGCPLMNLVCSKKSACAALAGMQSGALKAFALNIFWLRALVSMAR